MKKKLELNALEVKSFITNKEKARIQGGKEETHVDICGEPTEPAGCGQQTYTCPTFGYGDCSDNVRLCIG